TPDQFDSQGYPLYRQGTQVTLHATPKAFCTVYGSVPTQAWTFIEWQDNNVNQLSTSNPYTTVPLAGPLDVTARFDETAANATPRYFTTGNVVVAQIKDAQTPDPIALREYTPSGVLVQPPILIPDSGNPSGSANAFTSGVGFQIAFDKLNPTRLFTAVNRVDDGVNSDRTGFIRTYFSGSAWTF